MELEDFSIGGYAHAKCWYLDADPWVGGFILPLMGIQFRLLSVFREGQSYVAGGLAVLGLILLVLSFASQSEKP